MKIHSNKLLQRWKRVALLLIITALVTACGGSISTLTPEPSEEPTSMAETPLESPLAQPQSPLEQRESPLTTTVTKLTNVDEAIALAAVTEAPEPSEGFGAFSGLVYSFGSIPGSIPETQFYLAKAAQIEGEFTPPPIYTGPNVEEDVYGATSMAGQVQVGEVPPGNYYIAVWTLYGWLLAFPTPEEQQSPLLITIEEGDQLNLGVLYVNWP